MSNAQILITLLIVLAVYSYYLYWDKKRNPKYELRYKIKESGFVVSLEFDSFQEVNQWVNTLNLHTVGHVLCKHGKEIMMLKTLNIKV